MKFRGWPKAVFRSWPTCFVRLRNSTARANSSAALRPGEVADVNTVDLSGAGDYRPGADIDPNPRYLARRINELELRIKDLEEAKLKQGILKWLTR